MDPGACSPNSCRGRMEGRTKPHQAARKAPRGARGGQAEGQSSWWLAGACLDGGCVRSRLREKNRDLKSISANIWVPQERYIYRRKCVCEFRGEVFSTRRYYPACSAAGSILMQ